MCSLCGILGGNEHWTDAVARPGVYTRTTEPIDRRRERARRVMVVNRVLRRFGLKLSDWQGTSFLLSTFTGNTEIIGDFGHLWPAAEKLAGKPLDPLDAGLLAALKADAHG